MIELKRELELEALRWCLNVLDYPDQFRTAGNALFAEFSTGGMLHIVLVDFKVEDRDLASCRHEVLRHNYWEIDRKQADLRCLDALHLLAPSSREKVVRAAVFLNQDFVSGDRPD